MDVDYVTVHPCPGLPKNWVESVRALAANLGVDVSVKGRGPGSLEPEETAGLDYRVVNGIALRDSWVWDWYQSDTMVALVSAVVGESLKPSNDVSSAINVNYLRGQAARYETHVDAQPYSAVLMANFCDAITGGRLILGLDDGRRTEMVTTRPGMLVVFDGSKIAHAVEPLTRPGSWRISLPLVYVPVEAQERPDALNSYLYGGG